MTTDGTETKWHPTGPQPLTRHFQRLTQRARDLDRRRPLLWDLLVTGFFVTAALIDQTSGGWRNVAENPTHPGWLITTLSLGLTVPLLKRRTHPFAVLLTTLPFALVNTWTGASLQAGEVCLLTLFHIALRTRHSTLLRSYALAVLPYVFGGIRYPAEQGLDQNVVPAATALALASVAGIAVRTRKDYLASLVERAHQLEVERDQQLRLAAAAERARIAREMHDIIGHNLSVITGLADGGRYAAAKNPARATEALTAISTTSRQALAELRRLLDVLRDDPEDPAHPTPPADLAPQPTLTDLDRLLTGLRSAGLAVHTTVRGTPTLAPGRQLTVYRVIQEALTNTLKHAGPGATSQLHISYEESGAVALTLTDTARTPPTPPSPTHSGRGLPGMRERTALYGGTLEAGPLPHPQRGWRVHLHLPEETPQ
ncbi:sensor histidine kinase [Streptomyces phaeolivaceus]|uniref:histidine kinase n=1 Tax=Streptomyces phaeolivaceus TaxID=2653200 RepID=A0A5P8K7D9_9ACTN|nr:histidine kinase [Streptomyces phaeolivaceus]QFQ98459.1 sensor histidine kinase [Streptomyces phaeolivaceus]